MPEEVETPEEPTRNLGGRPKGSKTTVPQLLTDMRAVFRAKPKKGVPENQSRKELRAWLKENRGAFISKMESLERAALQAKSEAAAKEADKPKAAVDAGSERARGLVDQLLEEWEANAEDSSN